MKSFSSLSSESLMDRSRVGWWAYVLALGVVLGFVVYSFIGTFVLGIFAYYAARPLYGRISRVIDSDGIAAAATVLGFVLPVVLLLLYAGVHVATSLQASLGSLPGPIRMLIQRFTGIQSLSGAQWQSLSQLVSNPPRSFSMDQQTVQTVLQQGTAVLGTAVNVLLHLVLALAMAFYLLRDDDGIVGWFHDNVASKESTTGQYMAAVDTDLESLYFGNVLFVVVMSVIAAAVYYGTNMLAPQGLSIPIPLVLAVLTGVSSLIPLVVSKVVYVPIAAYLALSSIQTPGNQLAFVGGFLVVCLAVLDLAPQGVIQPYITGRKLHPGLLLFAYILGPIVWGWYGFFLLPLVVVLVIEVVRVTFTDLVHGDSLTPHVDAARSLGTTEPAAFSEDEDAGDGADERATDDGSPNDSDGGRGSGSNSPGDA
ncbi:AI-2E family transporter [Halogeometricum sp. S1BR25-6]|uniref:AI-2E family transporter n=1 Tax=Halogeometricum salsisoli TaxID=2950536 RepID=A0ABU2GCN1_9EURY|nr:AI-2E family transporter [Halogeometricum sp. S1BR25-6]MDS0298054.1 AI-2E family transporter [Halogeometricum sp. S1BR25-6]